MNTYLDLVDDLINFFQLLFFIDDILYRNY